MFELNKLIEGLSNEAYHKVQEKEEDRFFSSSQLKDILVDPEVFHKKYITQEIPRKHIPAFDVGSYYHTAILEPHLLEKEFGTYTGKVRRGKAWEDFQKANEGKTLLTVAMTEEAENLIKATKDSPIATGLLKNGNAEQSLFVNLHGLRIKVRFDHLCLGEKYSYIADLKSTSGNVKDVHAIQGKIASLHYELSAALYTMAVNQYIEENNLPFAKVEHFYLIFASKNLLSCKTYLLSKNQMYVGQREVLKAISEIKKYIACDWEFKDSISLVDPPQYLVEQWTSDEPTEEVPEVEVETKVTTEDLSRYI